MANTRRGYSPALDSMRGVFMVAFMAFHFGVTALEGVWTGINFFFTLSAFLIVRLLVAEQVRYGDVDVLAFYRRRVRRLLPALLVMLAAVSLWWGATSDGEVRRRLGGDVLATLGYVMNWRLLLQSDEYFGDVAASPLRHAWTLSIEEQFYVLVPFVVMALVAIFRRRRMWAVGALMAGAIASSLWTASLGLHDASDLPRLYYGTDTRAQSLLLGAALGMLLAPDRRGRMPAPLPYPVVMALWVVGLVSTVVSVWLIGAYTGWMFNQGGILVVGLASVCLIVAGLDRRASPFAAVFEWRPLVHTGRLSYGLYLWHWPIALILKEHLESTPLVVALGIASTYLVAHLSWTYLELPVIRGGIRGLVPTRFPVLVGSSAVAGIAALGLALSLTGPAPTKPTEGEVVGPVQPLVEGQVQYVPGEPARIAVLGDSVPYYLAERFPAADFPGVAVDNLAREGCDLLDEPLAMTPVFIRGSDEGCQELKRTWPGRFEEQQDQVLLVFGSPLLAIPHMVEEERLGIDDAAYRAVITGRLDTIREEAIGAGAEQVQIANVPCRRADAEALPPENREIFADDPGLVEDVAQPDELNEVIAAWAEGHDDVALIDLNAVLCADGPPDTINGLPIYNDFIHFSPEATPMLWTWILGQVSENYAALD